MLASSLLLAHLILPAHRVGFATSCRASRSPFVASIAFGEAFGAYLSEYLRNYISTYAGLASVMIALGLSLLGGAFVRIWRRAQRGDHQGPPDPAVWLTQRPRRGWMASLSALRSWRGKFARSSMRGE